MKPLAAAIFTRRMFASRRSRRRRVPRQRQPNAIRLAYAHALLQLLRRARELVDQVLVPKFKDLVIVAGVVHDAVRSYPDEVNDLIDSVSERFFKEFTNERLRQTALQMARRTSAFQKDELNRQLGAAFGREIGIDLFAEPGIERRLEAFAAANVKLVKRVPQQFFDEVGTQVVQALRSGQRAEDLQQVISDRYDISESRARLIARDQIGKLGGEINKARQQNLGIDSFTWRTSEDERVRPEHEELDGKTFDWTDLPSEGIPGEPINCRCTAEPDVQSVLDSL